MKNKIPVFLLGLLIGFFAAFVLVTSIQPAPIKKAVELEKEMKQLKQTACDKGYATYKPITEEWAWKENVIVVEHSVLYQWMKDRQIRIGE